MIFNPPAAPHHGGVWEGLIQLVKKTLLSVTTQQILDDEVLHTAMCKAESILNGHPLTTTSGDTNDLEALMPNHLLLLKNQSSLPSGLFTKDALGSKYSTLQLCFERDGSRNTFLEERSKWSRQSRNFVKGNAPHT